MTTKPKNDTASIALDARHTLAAAREDAHDPVFVKRIGKRELDAFEADITALEHGLGARTDALHSQVAAGVIVARARAVLFTALVDIRDDAKIQFPKDAALQHAFGVGATPAADSTTQLRAMTETVLSAAAAHPSEAKKLGLDAHGIRDLEHLVHALDGADLSHHHAALSRHSESTATDALAHSVAAEAAHLRLVAHRAFRGNDAKLKRYATSLPRHEVEHRTKPAAAAAVSGAAG